MKRIQKITIKQMILSIPTKILDILKYEKMNKTKQISFIKVVNSLLYKNSKANKNLQNVFFPVPSTYLIKVNKRYKDHINLLIKYKIITYKSINTSFSSYSLFDLDESYRHKYYNTHTNECMQYRFIIDLVNEEYTDIDIDIDFSKFYKDKKWYNITKKSLEKINQSVNIIRDSYSRRLHTSITNRIHNEEIVSYKALFCAYKGYTAIDIKECQPSLLLKFLKDNNVSIDDNFLKGDIYLQICKDNRNLAKKAFLTWLNSDIYMNVFTDLFPKVSKWMYNYKLKNGAKSISRRLQRIESEIIVDDILNNIENDLNIDFCLSVHDSLIVKNENIEIVKEYINEKYPFLNLKIEKFDIK